jgi:hypothetical protein
VLFRADQGTAGTCDTADPGKGGYRGPLDSEEKSCGHYNLPGWGCSSPFWAGRRAHARNGR